MKITTSGVDLRVVVWLRAVHRDNYLRKSGAPQRSVLAPLIFPAYVNDIWRNNESTIRLFTGDCIIYRKILNNNDMESLWIDLNRPGKWAFQNEMTIQLKVRSFVHESLSDGTTYLIHNRTY
jgi:hypothetical protein